MATDAHRTASSLDVLLILEATTVAVFSALHLSGILHATDTSGPSYGAGVAEALIFLALMAGAWALRRSGATRLALGSVVFAIFGFIVGLSFTVRGGDAIDLAYHAVMLPVLVATALRLRR